MGGPGNEDRGRPDRRPRPRLRHRQAGDDRARRQLDPQGRQAWHAARAISCLPALVGSYGNAGGGLGSRHGAAAHGAGFASITAADRRLPGRYIPDQMPKITASLVDGGVRVLLLFGSNMLSSYADSGRVATGLDKVDLVVCHELFMNETTRFFADIVLPGTAWLEDVGCKSTHTPFI